MNALLNSYDSYIVTPNTSYIADNFDLTLLSNVDYSVDNNNNNSNIHSVGNLYPKQEFTDVNVCNSKFNNNLGPLSIETDNTNQYLQQQIYMKKEENFYWQPEQTQQLSPYNFHNSSLLSPQSPDTTSSISTKICPPSPCPSLEYPLIKQEFTIQQHQQPPPQYQQYLPLSPPDSNGVPSPASSSSAYCDNDSFDESYSGHQNQLTQLINENYLNPQNDENILSSTTDLSDSKPQQDHQVLREFLQDTTFQRKHNLKPLALESLFGGWTERGDIEPVISLALEHAKREVQQTCKLLNISADPQLWTFQQVQLWISATLKQFKLDMIDNLGMVFPENGQQFLMLTEEELCRRVPSVSHFIGFSKSLNF